MNKEKKMRDFLKCIYELYSEVNDFIFTTYNYEKDFFDEHIVAYLMGFDRKICTIGEQDDANEWVKQKHISVYYDKNAVSPGDSRITVPVFPQNIKGGVFHPKVIVIYGKLKDKKKETAHLFVSSCNLTVSGYGRNKEAFACVKVASKQLAESLGDFIDSLDDDKRHEELKGFLKKIKEEDDDIEFIWKNAGRGTELCEYLKDSLKEASGNIIIVSPYFDEKGPKELLDALHVGGKTTIVPAVDNGRYNIHKKDYEALKAENICFSELSHDDFQFVHAKIIEFGDRVLVGSYNFTSAAINGLNAEAALVFNKNKVKEPLLKLESVSEEKFLPDDEHVSNRDEFEKDNKSLFVTVTVKWAESKIYIFAENIGSGNDYFLRIDGDKEEYNLNSEIKITPALRDVLLKHKSFSVYKNKSVCYKGLINELDLECRPEIRCENLADALREWLNYLSNDTDNKHKQRLINPEDGEAEKVPGVAASDTKDIFDNYYLVANSLENLLQHIKEDSEEKQIADKNLLGYLVTKPGSIENMIAFLQYNPEGNTNKDIIHEWLIIHYLQVAISFFPKKICHNGSNKIYKEKREQISNKLDEIEKKVREGIANKVDEEYLKWIEDEFKR